MKSSVVPQQPCMAMGLTLSSKSQLGLLMDKFHYFVIGIAFVRT